MLARPDHFSCCATGAAWGRLLEERLLGERCIVGMGIAGAKKKSGPGDGANRRGTKGTGLQVGVGLLARLELKRNRLPVDDCRF